MAGKPPVAQIYLLPLDGGEARPLTDLPKGAGSPVWSPNGRSLAFSSTTKPGDFEKKKDAEESDVRVITKAAYRMNGAGYSEPARPSHIWIADVPQILAAPQKAKPLTTGEFTENDPVWSKDGSQIYFTSNRVNEPYYQPPDSDLYVVSASGGESPRSPVSMARWAASP